MAVNYKAVAKKNPQKQTDPAKYYANIVTTGNFKLTPASISLNNLIT